MKHGKVVIRTADKRDLKTILDIIREHMRYDREFARRYYDRFFDESDEMTERDEVYVALLGDDIVGVIGYSRDYLSSDSGYWLGWFAVKEKYRRRRIGNRLLRRVERDLKAQGQRKVFVSTEDSNSVAKTFYTWNGFRTEGVIRDYYGDGEDELIMSKVLV